MSVFKLNYSKNIVMTLFFILTSAILSSCETFEIDKINNNDEIGELPKWTISINEIVKYPRAMNSEKEVLTFSGRTVWVRKHYELNSKSIESITKIPSKSKPGYYNLKVKLNRHGSMVAMRLSNDIPHQPWAFLVDGVYYRSVEFNSTPFKEDYSEILIKGPFDKSLSYFLEKYSKLNYEFFHPDR